MANSKEKLLEIDDLTWWYEDSPTLLYDDFNFDLYEKDFCFIVGKSGRWKTTLIRFLMGKLTPPKKMIFYKKEDIARYTDKERAIFKRKIWIVYQDFKLIEHKTVYENIAYPLKIVSIKPSKIKKRVNEILYQMDLMDKKDVQIPTLSGWEKQRVAISRALVTNPEFIIADEPTGNLDWENSQKIADYLIDLNNKGNTILLITHDMRLLDYVKEKTNIKIVNV